VDHPLDFGVDFAQGIATRRVPLTAPAGVPIMATYVLLINWTEKGITDYPDGLGRRGPRRYLMGRIFPR
jgi:hypothetical protein